MFAVVDYSQSPLSLLAPAVAIVMAILTHRVFLSLGIGILVGALLLVQGQFWDAVVLINNYFLKVFWENGWNIDNICILIFLLVLGVFTGLINLSGGANAFGEWAKSRIKSRRNCQILTVLLGGVIFIDDYFSSLAVGGVCRPLTDQYRISRAKLAYLIDSTAAPVCVIMPISSWGAYIIALLGSIMVMHNIPHVSPISVFMDMIVMNFYAIFSLALVICVAWMDLNVGGMKIHEDNAKRLGQLYDLKKGVPPGSSKVEALNQGKVADLILPLLSLVIVAILAFFITGGISVWHQGQTLTFFKVLENAGVGFSLVFASFFSLIMVVIRLYNRGLGAKLWCFAIKKGVLSMMPAIFILILAWLLGGITGDLSPGKYLASMINSGISPVYYPLIIFCISSLMALATGTSWGTFGIMLPIAGDMAAVLNSEMMLPMLSAVLSGAVFGDHCSPISDTSVLSSTGAACHHSDHVVTQLPYALVIALISACGYLVMGIWGSVLIAFIVTLVMFISVVALFRRYSVAYLQ